MGALISAFEGEDITQHIQPLSMIIVSDAGCADANGVYALISEEMGGRPVYAKLGEPTYRIQWLIEEEAWVLQHVNEEPLYCVSGRLDYTFPSDDSWRPWKKSKGAVPSIAIQPLTNIIVQEAGTSSLNGVYAPCPKTQCGRPVWAQVGRDDCRIIWCDKTSAWLINCNGRSPYRLNDTKEKTFPRGPSSWLTHEGGAPPVPTCQCKLRSNIIVKGAGTPGVDGLYVPCRETHGYRPVWTLLGSTEYRIRWSKSFHVWILEYRLNIALYRLDNCSDCTPPESAEWKCFQGGAEPTPSITFQTFCNIIISYASISEVNGVYGQTTEAVCGLPVWSKSPSQGQSQYTISWSDAVQKWALTDQQGSPLYMCKNVQYLNSDEPGHVTANSVRWVRYNDGQEDEDDDGLQVCYGSRKKNKLDDESSLLDGTGQSHSMIMAASHDDIAQKKISGKVAQTSSDNGTQQDDVRKKRNIGVPSSVSNVEDTQSTAVSSSASKTSIIEGSSVSSDDARRKHNIPPLKMPASKDKDDNLPKIASNIGSEASEVETPREDIGGDSKHVVKPQQKTLVGSQVLTATVVYQSVSMSSKQAVTKSSNTPPVVHRALQSPAPVSRPQSTGELGKTILNSEIMKSNHTMSSPMLPSPEDKRVNTSGSAKLQVVQDKSGSTFPRTSSVKMTIPSGSLGGSMTLPKGMIHSDGVSCTTSTAGSATFPSSPILGKHVVGPTSTLAARLATTQVPTSSPTLGPSANTLRRASSTAASPPATQANVINHSISYGQLPGSMTLPLSQQANAKQTISYVAPATPQMLGSSMALSVGSMSAPVTQQAKVLNQSSSGHHGIMTLPATQVRRLS